MEEKYVKNYLLIGFKIYGIFYFADMSERFSKFRLEYTMNIITVTFLLESVQFQDLKNAGLQLLRK